MTISGARILITGGTGSFGSRVAAHLRHKSPRSIRIFSRDEKKQWDMARHYPDFEYIVGDVRERETLERAVKDIDIVFHAAALKQVPTCEQFPWEAIKTNTVGSQNLCYVAERAGVGLVVALSTDKAVKPINAMGMSKALMEKIVTAQNQNRSTSTTFCCVRYGNVMGSRGSVIPLFVEQAKRGQPMTLTVPEMTRFLLTLDESVDLVFHAIESAKGGEIFVRKAVAATVLDLARAVGARHSPKGADHPVVTVGIRPGEKIHEVLVSEHESYRACEEGDYYVVHPEYRGVDTGTWTKGSEFTSENTRRLTTVEEIGALLDRAGQPEGYA